MHAGQVGGAGAAGPLDQRAQAGPGPGDVRRGDGPLDRAVDGPQEVLDVLAGAHGLVDVALVVGVGRPDVGRASPRHDEHRALVLGDGDDGGDVVADQVPGDGDVHTLGGPDAVRVLALVQCPDVVGPDAGGVDDAPGPDLDGTTVGFDGGPGHPPGVVLGDGAQRDPVGDDGAVVEGGGTGHLEHEAGVVGLGVVVEVGTRHAVPPQRRHVGHGLVGLEALVELADAQAAGEVVHPHGRAQGPGQAAVHQPVLGEDGDEERQHVDQVRRRVAQDLALPQGLVDEADLALLQVAQAAVHQLRGLRGGAGGEVVPFDQGGAQPTGGSVQGHARAGDPAADHEHVVGRVSQAVEGGGAVEVSRSGHGGNSLGGERAAGAEPRRHRSSTTRVRSLGCAAREVTGGVDLG